MNCEEPLQPLLKNMMYSIKFYTEVASLRSKERLTFADIFPLELHLLLRCLVLQHVGKGKWALWQNKIWVTIQYTNDKSRNCKKNCVLYTASARNGKTNKIQSNDKSKNFKNGVLYTPSESNYRTNKHNHTVPIILHNTHRQ